MCDVNRLACSYVHRFNKNNSAPFSNIAGAIFDTEEAAMDWVRDPACKQHHVALETTHQRLVLKSCGCVLV